MRFTTFARRGLALSALALLAACGGDEGGITGIDPTSQIPTTELQSKSSAVATITADPALQSLLGFGGGGFLRDEASSPVSAILGQVAGHVRAARSAMDGHVEHRSASLEVLPDSSRGKAYRWNGTAWYVDTSVPVPANGMRIYLYPMSSGGNMGTTSVGWLDLRDSSTTTTDILSVTVTNTNRAVVAALRQASVETQTSMTLVVSGTLGASQQIQVADTLSESGNGFMFRVNSRVPGQNLAARIAVDASSPTARSATRATLAIGERIARIEASSRADSGALANGPDSVSIFLDDKLVGRSVLQASQGDVDPLTTMVGADGKPLSAEVRSWVGALVNVFNSVPLGFQLALTISFLIFMVAEF